MAVSKIGYLWAAQHDLPIIKIFILDFFTVILFLAPIDRILCHGQFRIEAKSLQKRSDLPCLAYYNNFYCIEYALQLMAWLQRDLTRQPTAVAHGTHQFSSNR